MELPFSDPVLIFATVMVLILLAPLLARRIRLPEIVGLLAAGIVFGPHGVGMLARDSTIHLLGQVGLLYIMLLAGLEIDLHQVKQQRSHSLLFGMLTFLIPLGLGTWLGMWTLSMALPAAILMATMFSSHTLLTFPAAAKLGLSRSRAVTTTIGGTIITDTLALLVLAVIAAAAQGQLTTGFWITIGISIALYVAAVVLLVPRIGRWFLQRFSTDENVEFVSVLAIAFLFSYLAHVAGLEPIIGAFLTGLALNPLIPERSGLMSKLRFTGNALFIPFFLLSVGMLVNFELLLESPEAWIVIAVMTGVAISSKFAASYLSGILLRYSGAEKGLIFGLSVNQAAATLAAALVGYELGLFNDAIITGTIVMIGVTCFLGPIITERFGRRLAEERSRRSPTAIDGAPHRVMLAIESRDYAKELLELAFFLRSSRSEEAIYPVHVVAEGGNTEDRIAHGEKLLAHVVVRSLAASVPVSPSTTVDVNLTAGILRAAQENRASLLLMHWDGLRSGRPRMFGRSIDSVIERSPQQILINRLVSPVNTSKRIVCMLPPLADRQPGFAEAVTSVRFLASQAGTRLLFVVDSECTPATASFLTASKPAVSSEVQRYPRIKEVSGYLQALAEDGDWYIIMGARPGSISWQPAADRLVPQLLHYLPQHNLSWIFAPELQRRQPECGGTQLGDELTHVFPEKRTLLQSGDISIEPLLEHCLAGHLPARPARNLVDRLTRISATEPVELIPGIVLLHDHVQGLEDGMIFLATTRRPLVLPAIEAPVYGVIILLAPAGQDPARHLGTLAKIAGVVRAPGVAEGLREVDSYARLQKLVNGNKLD